MKLPTLQFSGSSLSQKYELVLHYIKKIKLLRYVLNIVRHTIKGEFIIDQIYKKYDVNVTQETRDYFNNWIKSENMQKFLETNYLVTEPKENVTGHITNIMSDLNKKDLLKR